MATRVRKAAEWSTARLSAIGIVIGLMIVSWNTGVISASDPEAAGTCQAMLEAGVSEYGTNVNVFRAELSNVAETVQWQEQRLPNVEFVSRLRSRPGSEAVTICLYTGEFVTPVGPPLVQGENNPPHNLLRIVVLNGGEAILDSAGYQGGSEPQTPGDWQRLHPAD
jgi:hypothetical protein